MDHDSTSVECRRLLSYILSAAGDCRLMISYVTSTEEWDKFREQTQVTTEIDREIQQAVDEIPLDETSTGTRLSEYDRSLSLFFLEGYSWLWELTSVTERNLFASVHAYEDAIDIVRSLGEQEKERLHLLTKRFGNARNEMGVYWMNQCARAVKLSDHHDGDKVSRSNDDGFISMNRVIQEIKDLFRKSFENFDAGIQAFEKIHDVSNVVLLHSNLGRLMRYHAEFYTPIVDGVRQEFSPQERQSYQKAFDYYLRGLKLVEHRPDLVDVYRTLSWELSNSYFTMATLLQDYAPLSSVSQEDVG